jgi:membrane associated rhomboid family serine protease
MTAPEANDVPPPDPTAPGPDQAAPDQVPHCYRHPDRETYVSCQRCGRPICPDCMRPAAVGFHCLDEGGHAPPARAGGRPGSGAAPGASGRGPDGRGPDGRGPDGRGPDGLSGPGRGGPRQPGPPRQRETRTIFGGRVPTGRPGLVTNVLIGLCVLAFLLEGFPGLTGGSTNQFQRDYDLNGFAIAVDHQYYRLLTAAFIHLSILHIAFNMFALYVLGVQLETILGRVRFVALFVACAVAGNTLSFLLHGLGAQSAGASTAIFGFFSAFYVIARRLRADTASILMILGINLIITFTLSGIDKWGHIGGLAAGLALGAVYAYIPPRHGYLQALLTLAVIGGCFGGAVAYAHSLV